MENIIAALVALDPDDDANWTKDGLPVLAKLTAAIGAPVTRAQIAEAIPGFTRSTHRASIAKARGAEDESEPEKSDPTPAADTSSAKPPQNEADDGDVPGLAALRRRCEADPEGVRVNLHKPDGSERTFVGAVAIERAIENGWQAEPCRAPNPEA